jgi:ribosomal protein S27E
MSNIEVAKDLLRKGILLGDPDLIAIANKLLGEPEEPKSLIITDISNTSTPPKKRGRPKKEEISQKPIDRQEEFSTIKRKRSDREVRWEGNTWKDTGETGDLPKKELKTPKVKRTERRPKYKKVSHKCKSCMNDFMVYPHDATEYFRCEKCLTALVGK